MRGLSRVRNGCVLCCWIVASGLHAGCLAQSVEPQSTGAAEQDSRSGAQDGASLQELQRRLAAQPDWTEGWWKLGTMAYDSDRFELAQTALRHVVAAMPQMGVAWALLGLSEFETKNFDPALEHLQHAATIGFGGDEEIQQVSSYHLGLLLIRAGRFEDAETVLESSFGTSANAQVKFALGLAALHVPLLPSEVDTSKEALVSEAGALQAEGVQSLADFKVFVRNNPGVPFAHYAYGVALEKAGKLQDALSAMEAETRVVPWSRLPWLAIARLDSKLGRREQARVAQSKADALGRDRQNEGARQLVAEYRGRGGEQLSKTPEDWQGAMQEYASGHYREAEAALKPWLQDHPNDGTAWAVLGLSEFALGDDDSALLHLQRGTSMGLRASPDAIRTARYTLGILLLHSGQFEEATETLASVAKLSPGDQKAVYALGLALLRRPELPGAAQSSDSDLVNAAGQIALLLEDSRYDEAFPKFKILLAQYPRTPFLHYTYGTALMELSEFEAATAEMEEEAKISPTSALPYLRMASIDLREHRAKEALGPAQRALALSPDSADGHYLLGRALLETGDERAAIRELEQASRLSPGSPEVHFNLAKAYARANMAEQAAAERATFARLSELAEAQKNGHGSQIYTGPRGTDGLTGMVSTPH